MKPETDMDQQQRRASALVRRLAALPEPQFRATVLLEQLRALPTASAASLAGEIVRRGPSGAPYDVALLALSDVLDGTLVATHARMSYEEVAALYAVAREQGDILLVRLLLAAQPTPDGTPQRAVIPERPDVTLGERKSLARTRRPELLDRMLRDPDPAVLTILLHNPRLTEAHVIRLAARRPTTPEAQRLIFRAPRFRTRYGVRRALVLNPYTPSDLAAQLTGLLTEPDLRTVVNDSQLAEPVRAAARAQLCLIPTER